jgi:hypothetical protein
MANQSQDILSCIDLLGPITAEDITIRTEWNRHIVDLTIAALIKEGWIYQSGTTEEFADPLYSSALDHL